MDLYHPLPPLRPAAPEPTRPQRIALRIVQVGAVVAVLVATPDFIFELDRFFIPKEVILHVTAFAAGLFAFGGIRRLQPTRVDLFLVGYLAVSTLSVLFATNVWAGTRALAVSVSGVVLFWTARALREAGLARALVRGLAVAVVVAAVTALLQAYGLTTDFFSVNRAPGGTLGNRNFIGHLAAFGFPLVVLATLGAERPKVVVQGLVGSAFLLGVLLLTRSRAAWLAIAAVLVILLAGILLFRAVRREGRFFRRFVLLLLAGALGVVAAVNLPNALAWRSDSPYLESARRVVDYRDGSGAGRLTQYANSLAMTLRHPILGVGPGNWSVVYPAYADRGDPSLDPNERGMTSNPWPSSDWVAVLSERGPIAFALLGLAWLRLMLATLRQLRAGEDGERGLESVTLLAVLAGAAVTGLFDAVLLLAWPTLILWTAVGALWPAAEAPPIETRGLVRIAVPLVILLLAGAGALQSAGRLAAVRIYAADNSRAALEWAAKVDPGNYRLHLRLAHRTRNDREQRCAYAVAAHELFPEAAAAARLARPCL